MLPILLYTGTLDPFAPLHIVPIMEINHNGNISGDLAINNPIFYTIGSSLSLITGISPENLLFYPIQLIPAILIMFILFRKISGSNLVASLITIILATIDVNGDKFFFWVHGMGSILFFMVIFLLLNQLKRNRSEYILLIFISIAALVYTSYDLTFSIISLLVALILLLTFNKRINLSAPVNSRQHSQFFSILMFLLVFQLALSEFIYKTLIPQFQSTEGSNPLDNFLFSYLSTSTSSNLPISVVYPQIISIMGILKYLIVGIFIILALVFIIKKLKNTRSLGGEYNILFIGMIVAISAYMGAKFVMGQFAIGDAFLIGLFAIAVVYMNSNNGSIKKISVLALVSILVINLGIFAAYSYDGFINKDSNDFNYMSYGADWYLNYSNSNGTIKSDVLTSYFYYLFISKGYINNGENINQYDYIQALNPYDDIYPIIQLPTTDKIKKSGYYVLNNKLNSLDLNGWKTVKPWRDYQSEIDSNTNYSQIYNSGDLSVLY